MAPGEIQSRAVTYDRLALIITRLDPDERLDLVRDYCVTLESDSVQ
jgi:hypothetical protein